jgi:hypothetical protein
MANNVNGMVFIPLRIVSCATPITKCKGMKPKIPDPAEDILLINMEQNFREPKKKKKGRIKGKKKQTRVSLR